MVAGFVALSGGGERRGEVDPERGLGACEGRVKLVKRAGEHVDRFGIAEAG